MPKLRIDLREGFAGDAVEILIDDRVVYSRADVRTNYSAGIADSFEVDVAPATVAVIEVRVPARNLVGSRSFKPAGSTQHVAVVLGERIDIQPLTEPPQYF